MATAIFSEDEVRELLDMVERRLLAHNVADFVSVDGSNYVFIGRVQRAFDSGRTDLRSMAEERCGE